MSIAFNTTVPNRNKTQLTVHGYKLRNFKSFEQFIEIGKRFGLSGLPNRQQKAIKMKVFVSTTAIYYILIKHEKQGFIK